MSAQEPVPTTATLVERCGHCNTPHIFSRRTLEERIKTLESVLGMLGYDENGHIESWPSEAETRRVLAALQAAGSAK